jgi:surface carbohydrate biosynthesis protein (TIGR04326 family)
MTANRVVLWDQKSEPAIIEDEILCWQSYSEYDSLLSVPRYVEHHAERLRKKYLAFIHDLGEYRIAGKRVVDHMNLGDGFSMWWMTTLAEKSPLKSPRIYDCLRLLAIEEILVAKHTSDLTLVSCDTTLADAVRQLCKNLQIQFCWRSKGDSERKSLLRRFHDAFPYAVRGLLSLRHIAKRWSLRGLEKPQWFAGKDAVFICSYFIHLDPVRLAQGEFRSRQWEALPKSLQDAGKRINWIQLFLFSNAVPDVATGLNLLRRFNKDVRNQGGHAFLESYLTLGLVGRVLRTWLWLNVVSWRLRSIQSACNPNQSAVWLWPVLRNDWKSSITGPVAISNCLWIALFDAALADMPRQKIGLYLCENQSWERALLRAWRRHGHGEIIAVQHATVPFWHLYYFDDPRNFNEGRECMLPLPDRFALNGMASVRAFVSDGYPSERLVEVEALRYLGLYGMNTARSRNGDGHAVPERPAAERRQVCVVILGDLMPASTHHLLRLVEEAAQLLPYEFKWTFKPHPGLAVNLADYPGIAAGETNEALGAMLSGYDVAIAANNTSASVDAYLAGLHVIIGLDGKSLNLSPFCGLQAARFVTTGEELAEALEEVRHKSAPDHDREDFFFMDPGLPRWKRLLGYA